MVGPKEKFSKLVFRLIFASTLFRKRAILLILYAEYTESMLRILSHLKVYYGPTLGGLREKFSKSRFSEGWKALFKD